MRVLLSRLRGLLHRRKLDSRLDEELRFHLEMETAANRKRGMASQDASQAARRAFGGAEQMKEIYREQRGLPMIEVALKDLRYAFRAIRRSPGFTVVAVLSLALGIGANTAIFTLINAVMLRPLPVRSPGELVTVGDAARPNSFHEGEPMMNTLSYPLYERLRDQNRVFMGLLASGRTGRIDMRVGDGALEQVHGRLVSGNYFEVLGVVPVRGRVFSEKENQAAIVIGYDFWVNRFASDPAILGRTVTLNGSSFTVIGVGPPHFAGDVVGSPADLWIPISMQARVNPGYPRLDRRDSNWILCMGRLKPGVSIQKARAEITMLAQQALADYEGAALTPEKLRDIRTQTIDVEAGGKGFSGIRKRNSPMLFTLMIAVALVLAIACANVANLLLARATKRQKEISVRLALGASRGRLIRQLLTESALFAALGGVAGLMLAGWGTRALLRIASPNSNPFDVDVHPDFIILGFTAAISAVTAILSGLVPALRSTRMDLTPALKENARSVAQGWGLGRLLVAGQLALSLVLLIGAGLFVRSLAHLDSLDVGYSRRDLLLLSADIAGAGYGPQQLLPATRKLMDRLRSLPGVLGVTVSENGIFSGTDSGTDSLRVDGFTPMRKEDSAGSYDQVGPHYFQVVGVPILKGRDFDEHDTAGTPEVAIVNDTMAQFYFPHGDPLGKVLYNGHDRYTIIGVVKDMKEGNLKGKPDRRFFVPLFQSTDKIGTVNFEVRTREDAAGVATVVRREMESFNRDLKVLSLEPVRVLIERSINDDRMIARLSGFFGVLALLLAVTGLYGVISYATSRRANEIGLRMALGASRNDVIGMILRETLILMGAGFAIGIPAALGATRLIGATLAGVGPNDPLTVGVVSVVMLIAGVVAGLIPAERAARIDPVAALRQE